ncbi:MAG: response regulator [bacterium]
MRERRSDHVILIADDDPDDRLLAEEALHEYDPLLELRFVKDGRQLVEYLNHDGQFSDPNSSPRPGLILLDLNMPFKSGLEALVEIKSDPVLKLIPVIVMTTSRSNEDIVNSYSAGVNAFITKPLAFSEFSRMINVLCTYWLEHVNLPIIDEMGKNIRMEPVEQVS